MKCAFYSISKAFFVLKIFVQNLRDHSLVNKQLQFTYYSKSHEVKGIKQ